MKIAPAPAGIENPEYFDPYDLVSELYSQLRHSNFGMEYPDLYSRIVHVHYCTQKRIFLGKSKLIIPPNEK